MIRKLTFWILLIFTFSAVAQINTRDSSAQIVGYWFIGESQTYSIQEDYFKIHDGDTIESSKLIYNVDITVLDSSVATYALEWFIYNVQMESSVPILIPIHKIKEELSIILLTDEFGALREVINWKDLRKYALKAFRELHSEVRSDKDASRLVEQHEEPYLTQEGIQSQVISDALQYHTFYGAKYEYGSPVAAEMQITNPYESRPLDAHISVSMDSLNLKEGSITLRMVQEVDSEQLTKSLYNHRLSQKRKLPALRQFPKSIRKSTTLANIHGYTGWIVYSRETKVIASEGIREVFIRDIRLL